MDRDPADQPAPAPAPLPNSFADALKFYNQARVFYPILPEEAVFGLAPLDQAYSQFLGCADGKAHFQLILPINAPGMLHEAGHAFICAVTKAIATDGVDGPVRTKIAVDYLTIRGATPPYPAVPTYAAGIEEFVADGFAKLLYTMISGDPGFIGLYPNPAPGVDFPFVKVREFFDGLVGQAIPKPVAAVPDAQVTPAVTTASSRRLLSTPASVIDYYSPAPAVAVIAFKQAGVSGVCRYLVNGDWRTNNKALKDWEVEQLLSAGLDIFPVYETRPTQVSYFSQAQGNYDAHSATDQARAIGVPAGTTLYFAVDFDLRVFTPDGKATLTDYCNGLESYPTEYTYGIYGGYYVCRHARENFPNLGRHLWQTVAWSDGNVLEGLDLYQYLTGSIGAQPIAGIPVDYNYAYVINWRKEEEMFKDDPDAVAYRQNVFDTITAMKQAYDPLVAWAAAEGKIEADQQAAIFGLQARIDKLKTI